MSTVQPSTVNNGYPLATNSPNHSNYYPSPGDSSYLNGGGNHYYNTFNGYATGISNPNTSNHLSNINYASDSNNPGISNGTSNYPAEYLTNGISSGAHYGDSLAGQNGQVHINYHQGPTWDGPNVGLINAPLPITPRPAALPAQVISQPPTVTAGSRRVRLCQGSRKKGVPCIHNPPKRAWKQTGKVRQCTNCLANPPARDVRDGMDARLDAGRVPCSKCFRKDARDGGGLCNTCLNMGKSNKALRKKGQGKRSKKATRNDDSGSNPRGGPSGGPPKGGGNGGQGPPPSAGAVGAVLSESVQWAY
ncbi:hypothetical protein NEUTE1DRAFT_138101 [Neurospora tetrasperma FGSC 2508]|uniref:Uncharacterized protein n=1 Tax=Neurospora tetrasperma (strain FGSC 2508 / ATCC MYA-4615 / P0657) TaxID=510951 RepID=F8ML99_NEUT8|nr:uncharacterized protein NEUTE1DRAFT_138101 [Neurospora tetrasperma FGSC 2508]EGO58372.1 hypothetical protein NEUTE1DRAFT_138101 [Neurospora tetrasperma FGSC 2508]